MFGLEVPGSGHPATTAAPKAEVFAEEFHITSVVAERAVNEVLLGETDRSLRGLGCDRALESRVGSEGPAGAATTLILDLVHRTAFDPVDCRSRDDTEATPEATLRPVVVEFSAIESGLLLPA